MNEAVFLMFVPIALGLVGCALWFFRHWESEFGWYRFRISSLIWIGVTALVAAGFVNLSDSVLLVAIWLSISLIFIGRVLLNSDSMQSPVRLVWIVLMTVPVSGWILYVHRFPYLHEADAEYSRG